MTIRMAILGHGRMGQALEQYIQQSDDLILSGIWVRNSSTELSPRQSSFSDDLHAVLSASQVAMDFTLPEVTEDIIRAAASTLTPLVCGVSGISSDSTKLLVDASADIPILYDRNMSLGIALLQKMVTLAGAAMGDEFKAQIHETHHMNKIDAPSGTALQLGESLATSRKQSFEDVFHYDPSGTNRPSNDQIHFEVSRRGNVPGEHTVLFESAHESLSLKHTVDDRRVFAAGAIKAARWLIRQPAGYYSMQDLV